LVLKVEILLPGKLDVGDAVFFGRQMIAKEAFIKVVAVMDEKTAGDFV